MSSPNWIHRSLIILLTLSLAGGPQLLAAQQATPTTQGQPQSPSEQPVPATSDPQAQPVPPASDNQVQPAPQTDQNVGTSQESATPDPSKGPLQPNENQSLPNAPSATQAQQSSSSSQDQQPKEAPLGAAAAQAGKTTGGAASKPAGTAIAPAKQRQTRSLLIKVGFIAAAAGAAGIVYGLSRSTPGVPPGAGTTTNTSAVH